MSSYYHDDLFKKAYKKMLNEELDKSRKIKNYYSKSYIKSSFNSINKSLNTGEESNDESFTLDKDLTTCNVGIILVAAMMVVCIAARVLSQKIAVVIPLLSLIVAMVILVRRHKSLKIKITEYRIKSSHE